MALVSSVFAKSIFLVVCNFSSLPFFGIFHFFVFPFLMLSFYITKRDQYFDSLTMTVKLSRNEFMCQSSWFVLV